MELIDEVEAEINSIQAEINEMSSRFSYIQLEAQLLLFERIKRHLENEQGGNSKRSIRGMDK